MNIFTFMKQCFLKYNFVNLIWQFNDYDNFKSIYFYEDIESFVLSNYFFERNFQYMREFEETPYQKTVNFMRKYVL